MKRLSAALFTALFLFSAFAQAAVCSSAHLQKGSRILDARDLEALGFSVVTGAARGSPILRIVDNSHFVPGHVLGSVMTPEGFISFDILVPREANGKPRIRGFELFDYMMKVFGPKAKGINARWAGADNQATFIEMLRAGKSPEEAARLTWTGKMAARYGMIHVSQVTVTKKNLPTDLSLQAIAASRDWRAYTFDVTFSKDPL